MALDGVAFAGTLEASLAMGSSANRSKSRWLFGAVEARLAMSRFASEAGMAVSSRSKSNSRWPLRPPMRTWLCALFQAPFGILQDDLLF